eukprot:jgi/Tetstr1/427683/TSEL_017808.t1
MSPLTLLRGRLTRAREAGAQLSQLQQHCLGHSCEYNQEAFRSRSSWARLPINGPAAGLAAYGTTTAQVDGRRLLINDTFRGSTLHAASFASSADARSPPPTPPDTQTNTNSAQTPDVAPSEWATVPPLVKAVGLAGVIPFVILSPPVAAVVPFMPIDVLQHAAILQTSYGISIATFLGGVHWGMAMAEYGGRALSSKAAGERYLWSVTPSLVAFPAVMLPPAQASIVITGTLAAAYVVDGRFTANGLLPKWYMALRLPLTVGAISGMMATAYHFLYLV